MLTGPSSCQGEGASLTAGSTGEENPRGNDNKCEVFALNSSVIDTCVCVCEAQSVIHETIQKHTAQFALHRSL